MANESNLLSTPEGYATPAQLQSTREYAKALLQGNLQQPVHHWTQGVSNMISALVGGNMDFNSAQKEKAALLNQAKLQQSNIPADNFPAGGVAPVPFSGSPSSEGQKNADVGLSGSAPGTPRGIRNNNPLNIEAGSFTRSQPGYMGSDGRFAQFAKPEHGIAAANALLDSYENRGINTVTGIVNRWAPPGENDSGAYVRAVASKLGLDPNAPVPRELRPQLIAAMGQHENGRPIQVAQNGSPSATQMTAGALRGGPSPSPKFNPEPAGEPPMVNPALVQKPPAYTRPNLIGTMGNPWTSPAEKQNAYEMALKQNQPMFMPSPTGSGQILINPNAPGTQQYFAPAPHFGETALGDLKKQVPTTFDRYGNPIQQTPTTVGPRSEAAPATAPTGGPTGSPPIVPVTAQNAPAAPTAAPETVPNTGGVQVASNDPTAGTAAAGATPVKAEGPLAQFAQATPPGATEAQLKLHGFSPQDVQDYTSKKAFDQAQALKQKQGESDIGVKAEAQKKLNDTYAKKYDMIQNNAVGAAEQRNNVAMARKMTEDPNFYAGLGSGLVENWKKFKVAMGLDPDAARPIEVFRKTTAQTIMSNLKTAFGGLGQIRNMEILLQRDANASNSNTPSAIKALLEITDRNAAKIEEFGKMAAAYKNGEAIMDPKDPSKVLLPANPEGERIGLDSHWDKFLLQYYKDHPTFSPEEFDKFTEDLKGRKGEKDMVEPKSGEAKSLGATEPGMTYKGHLFKGGDQTDPNNWETAPKATDPNNWETAPKAKAK